MMMMVYIIKLFISLQASCRDTDNLLGRDDEYEILYIIWNDTFLVRTTVQGFLFECGHYPEASSSPLYNNTTAI